MVDSKLKITVLYESWGEEEEAAPEPEKNDADIEYPRAEILPECNVEPEIVTA